MKTKNKNKKNMFKHAMALVLSLIMVFSLIGCGDKNQEDEKVVSEEPSSEQTDNKETDQEDSSQEEADTIDSDGDITSWIIQDDPESISGSVNFWIPFKGEQGMDNMIAEFNEIYPNITVNLHTYSNNIDGNASVNSAIMAGEVDVLASFGLSATYKRWANDLFIDLTPYIEKYDIDIAANWGVEEYKYNDTYYTFPCGALSYYICINQNAWVEAGLSLDDLPTDEWTWDEYLEACKAMTKGEGDTKVYGGSDYQSINYFLYPWAQVYGHDYYYALNGTETNFTDELIVNSLKREIKAEQEDCIWFPLVTYRSDSITAQDNYMSGRVASIITNNMTRFIADTETYPEYDWVTYFAPYPVEEKGQDNHLSGVSAFSHAGIATGCQDEDAAWAFLSWYSTYGVKWLAAAGHLPGWLGTDADALVEICFGSEEKAAELVDVESYKRTVVNYDNPTYQETVTAAYSEVNSILDEYTMYAHNGQMTPEDAMAEAKEKADAAIAKELGE